VARVVVTATARADLHELIRTHSLPADTESRLGSALQPLAGFPRLGPELGGRFAGRRFILGPWRWMVVVYRWHEDRDLVAVLAIVDARSAGSPTRRR
jgi:plasmid stabilization system protein ParE